MPTAFAVEQDVLDLLQEYDQRGALQTSFVEAAINAASQKFARQTNGHWFDSGATLGGDVDSTAASESNVRLDVPSSPHRTDRQLLSHHQGVKYPVTHSGPMAQILLPHLHVSSVTALDVRDHGGDYTDWVADSAFTEGRGEDYYIESPGQDSYGRTYLYINGASLPGVVDYENMIAIDYDYGLDWASTEWHDVRRGIAHLAATEVMDDDDVLTQIPDNGQIIGVDTQYQNLLDAAANYLNPYISSVA